MIEIEFNKKVKCTVDKLTVQKIVFVAAKKEKAIKGKVEINIVSDLEIKDLNRKYRGKNKVTDVLSFGGGGEGFPREEKKFGQIFICYPQIERQAKQFEVTKKEEFARMLIHGLLHLAGYDHVESKGAERMFGVQEGVVIELMKK